MFGTVMPVPGNVLAEIRRIPVRGQLESLLPAGGLQRGSVITVGGDVGAGVTSAAFELAAATTAVGEWAAFVDPGSFGGKAAVEAGVTLERCAVIRNVSAQRWALTIGALLDGITMVCASVPGGLTLGDARRLQARARERKAILVILETVPGIRVDAWPGEAALRIYVGPERQYEIAGKGIPPHLRLAQAG